MKNSLKQLIIKNGLRRKGVQIGKKSFISPRSTIHKNVVIKDYCMIGENTILNEGVVIGSYAKISNIEVGLNSSIETGVICTGYGNGKIVIGNESYIGINNILDWSADISIGNFVHIAGPSTGLWTHSSVNQSISGMPLKSKDEKYRPVAPIVIENNVYIGGNCTVYPGITIKTHSVVTPNCVVSKDVQSYTMVGGVPGKVIKNIDH